MENSDPGEQLTLDGHDLFQAYIWLREYRTLPVTGGWIEQTAAFVDAVTYCDKVHAAYCRRKEAKNKTADKMDKQLESMRRRVNK